MNSEPQGPASPSDQAARPRLLVLLGAGSTIHAGAPSTQEITDRVCAIQEEPIRSVVEYLRNQRTRGGFTFETILASLEELDEFSLRKRVPNAWQRVGGHLSAFAELLPDFAKSVGVLGSPQESVFMDARWKLAGGLSEFVNGKTANSSPARLKAFLDRLREEFDLTVVTLNYDDLIDRAGDWYDGFEPASSSTEFGAFDFAGFRRQVTTHPHHDDRRHPRIRVRPRGVQHARVHGCRQDR